MFDLILHPACAPGPIHSVRANCEATPHGCEATFQLEGDVSAIRVPGQDVLQRTDNLWKTTCFEIFWQAQDAVGGGAPYREFNLSPSGRWAAYDFDDVRVNSRDAPVDAISVSRSHDERMLELSCDIASELPVPAAVALNAIIEDARGNLQFWALAFADGKAEFHSPVCRALKLGERA